MKSDHDWSLADSFIKTMWAGLKLILIVNKYIDFFILIILLSIKTVKMIVTIFQHICT